ncbi:MAG: hypothetical protein JO254_05285, partial [Pseudolabrys sp.]|nr:hypothetical protein [Pseudolabrys sp.]
MRTVRFDYLLAGTALSLIVAIGQPAFAQDKTTSGVPMPESANVPPPSAKDVAPASTSAPVQAAQPAPAP